MKAKPKTESKKADSKISKEYLWQGVKIMPLKDREIHHNEHHIFIKEGEPVTIPRIFLTNMVTEGVIKSLPKEG